MDQSPSSVQLDPDLNEPLTIFSQADISDEGLRWGLDLMFRAKLIGKKFTKPADLQVVYNCVVAVLPKLLNHPWGPEALFWAFVPYCNQEDTMYHRAWADAGACHAWWRAMAQSPNNPAVIYTGSMASLHAMTCRTEPIPAVDFTDMLRVLETTDFQIVNVTSCDDMGKENLRNRGTPKTVCIGLDG